MTANVQFIDNNGNVMAVGMNYHETPSIGDSIYNPGFKSWGHPATMKVFNKVWDMTQSHTVIRIYLTRG